MTVRVLLVDDHQIMREGLVALLDQTGDIEVIAQAATGAEGLEKALALCPDVVIMDLTLPGFSGIEAIRQILATHPWQPILALSMLQDKGCVAECLKAGAKGYLVKNCAGEELVDAIRAIAAGGSYLCDQVTHLVGQDCTEFDLEGDSTRSLSCLTTREREVLRLLATGSHTKEIAFQLGISAKTVDVHRFNLMKKLGICNIADLTKYAIREGLIPIG